MEVLSHSEHTAAVCDTRPEF